MPEIVPEMVTIREEDLIESIADALQYISYFHPMDYIRALAAAYEREENPAAKDAMAQVLANSKMCAQGHRPICQDTGIVNVFLKWGQNCRLESDKSLQEVVDEGVRRAYNHPENKLRASIVDWVLEMIPQMGAGWCPPGQIGIGIGGTAEKAVLLAKESLMDEIDIHEIKARGPQTDIEKLRVEIYDKVNALGIGAQGLGGLTTVLDVKIKEWPCHAAGKPVAMIPNCSATRHAHFTLDGSGPSFLETPKLDEWPDVSWSPDKDAKRVDLDTLTAEEVQSWKHGDRLLLNGKMLTGRDAAHKRIQDMLARGEELPVDFRGRAIYYVGPVDPVVGEVVGPAGPTTATRMDKFTDMMLDLGLLAMIGKAERGQGATQVIAKHKVAYLMAVGGAAYLVARAIREAKVLGFEDLGMEAIYEFTVQDMPVTVAVDSEGNNVHQLAPKIWSAKIAEDAIPA